MIDKRQSMVVIMQPETDLKNALITTIALLSLDVQRKIQALKNEFSIGNMSVDAKREYERLLGEFDFLKVRMKAIQNND